MISTLVGNQLRNPALWTMSFLAAAGAAFAPLYMGLLGLFVLANMIPIAVPPSVSLFEAALPISASTIMRSRWLSALALATPLLVTVLIAAPLRIGNAHDPLRVLFAATLVVTAAMMIYLVPARIGPPPRVHAMAASAFLAAGAALAYFSPSDLALGVMIVAAVVCYQVMVTRIPQVIVARDGVSNSRTSTAANVQRDLQTAWPWRRMLRTAFPQYVAIFPAFAFNVGMGSDGVSLAMLTGVLMSLTIVMRPRIAWLAQLPISPRARLLLMIGPSFVLSFATAVITANLPFLRYGSLGEDAPLRQSEYRSATRVAINHWQRYESGMAPSVSAPWGESVSADTLSVFGVHIFNPYTTSEGSSEEFRVWQFARATQAVFGFSIRSAEYARLDSLNAVPVPVSRTHRLIYVRLACMAALALTVLCLIEFSRWHRLRRRELLNLILLFTLPMVALGPLVGEIVFHVRTGGRLVVPLIDAAMLRLSPWLPESTALTVLVCLLPCVALYFLLEWQFKRSERTNFDTVSAATTG